MHESLQVKLNESLPWLTGQRWYGDKGRSLKSATLEQALPVDTGRESVILSIIRCEYEDGTEARYFLPVVGLDQGEIRDGFTDDRFRTWFYEGFLRDRVIETDGGVWSWKCIGSVSHLAAIRFESNQLMRREQSNSSIVYDDRLIAKVFRKLEPGLNPDVEIGAMFAEARARVATPAMVGSVTLEVDGRTTIVAILQQFVHNVGDGWGWLLDQLRTNSGGTIEALRTLGERTGEMHVALAYGSAEPEFAPERFTNSDLEQWQARLVSEVELTFAGLRQRQVESDERLGELEASLKGRATNLDPLLGTLRIRIHGDYHLGQVLRTVENNFSIIDFEGEPSRPMEQRRLKWPALRDIAGMVRSFDYAAETISRERGGDPNLAIWREAASDAFIEGYRETVGDPKGLFPEHLGSFRFALAAVTIEKALYEARYEMDNRPDWLPIPFEALRRLATYH